MNKVEDIQGKTGLQGQTGESGQTKILKGDRGQTGAKVDRNKWKQRTTRIKVNKVQLEFW